MCGRRQGAEKRDQVDLYLTRGRGNIYPTDNYITEHVILANRACNVNPYVPGRTV